MTDKNGNILVSIVDTNGVAVGTAANPLNTASSGGGGGGGAVTIADNADVAAGATTDTPSTNVEDATPRSRVSLLKGIKNYLRTIGAWALGAGATDATVQRVVLSTDTTVPNVSGNVAHDAVDAGAPVKIGGKAVSSAPSNVTNADRVDGWFGLQGALAIMTGASATIGDGVVAAPWAAPNGGSVAAAAGSMLFNGASVSWDRQRNNHEVTALASAARTASVNSADLVNYNARGVAVVIDCTANSSTGGLTSVIIKYKDTLSGKYVTLLSSGTILQASATGTISLIVYPGVTISANLTASAPLPRVWRIEVTHADASSITYSIGVNYIL